MYRNGTVFEKHLQGGGVVPVLVGEENSRKLLRYDACRIKGRRQGLGGASRVDQNRGIAGGEQSCVACGAGIEQLQRVGIFHHISLAERGR